MAENKFAKKVSAFKYSMIAAQKTLLSQVSEIVPREDVIEKWNWLSGKKFSRVVVIFGDSLSIVYDAIDYLKNYHEKFGKYPIIICFPGKSLSRYISFGLPVETWMRLILVTNGIPEELIYSYDQNGLAYDSKKVLKSFLHSTRYKRVAVFAPRGYSVSTIISLKQEMPNIDFKFFNKEYVSVGYVENDGLKSNCIFDTDILDSLGMDLILGELVRLNLVYDSLPEYLQTYLMPLDKVKKFTDKGYILGLNTVEEMDAVGISVDQFCEILIKRLNDFDWLADPKRRIYEQILSLND